VHVAARDSTSEHVTAVESGAALRWALLLVASVIVSGLAVWMISPRFEIDSPSLVDDWFGVAHSSDQLSDVLRFTNPETQRFRPGVVVWTYVQWHTFDAPGGLVGPNFWNVVRLLTLVAGLCLFTALALSVRRGAGQAALFAGLASLPAFVVVLVPKFARDLARFGPQEPLLVGGMALGGSLLVLAGKALLTGSGPIQPWRIAALAIAGSAWWVLGVYHKETSLCVLPLMAAVLLAGRSRLESWPRLSTSRKVALAALGAVAVLPLVHVGVETVRIVARGDLIYDARVDSGRGALRGLVDLYEWAHEALPDNARLLMYGAVVLTALATVVRRRIDLIAVAALVSGVLSLAFAGQSGVLATRFYIPAFALFAVAFALSLARLPTPIQAVGLLAVVFSFMPPPGTRDEVQSWTDEELQGAALVRTVSEADDSGCPVAIAGLDPETTEALTVLVGLERRSGEQPCRDTDAYFVVGPGEEGAALASACVPGTLEQIHEAPLEHPVSVRRCGQLGAQPVRDPSFGLVEPEKLVALRRFQPAVVGS
jgi:hypothetical protein